MRAEHKAKILDAWARYFKKNPDVAARYARLADELRGQAQTDTRQKCCEDGCTERALTNEDGTVASRRCYGHYVDGVL